MNVTAEDLKQIPLPERLQLVHDLWDQIAAEDHQPSLPPGAVDEATVRIAELRSDPSFGLTEQELWNRVDARRG